MSNTNKIKYLRISELVVFVNEHFELSFPFLYLEKSFVFTKLFKWNDTIG